MIFWRLKLDRPNTICSAWAWLAVCHSLNIWTSTLETEESRWRCLIGILPSSATCIGRKYHCRLLQQSSVPILPSKYDWWLILIAHKKRRAEISFQHGMDYQQINIIRPLFVTTTNIFCIGSWTIAAWFAFRDYTTRTRPSVFQSWSRPHPHKPWFQRFGSLQFCCSRLTTDLKVASNFFLVKF